MTTVEVYRGIVTVGYDELTRSDDGEAVMKVDTLKSLLRRRPTLRVSRGGGVGTSARIDYYGLREEYRERYEAKYGDPRKRLATMKLREKLALVIDADARRWFGEYRYGQKGVEMSLPEDVIGMLTVNASVLNRLIAAIDDRKVYRKACGGRDIGVTDDIGDLNEELREAYGHTLPSTMPRLREKIKQYRGEGYGCLLSGKFGNSNSITITTEVGDWLVGQKRSATPVLTDGQIHALYNEVAEARGWKPLKSVRTVTNYLNRPEVKVRWYDAVHGELAATQLFSRRHRTKLPTRRDSLWYGDGTKLNLYYRAMAGGRWVVRTTSVYEVIDAYSEVLLGYHISDSENFEAQYHAFRMAIQESGHKPFELVHDNQGGHKKIGDWLDRLARVHRATMPYNGQSKTIESVFGRFQAQVLHKDWRFTGQNITAKRVTSRANMERIAANVDQLYTLEELKEAYARARREWNEGAHHETGVSRIEMYRSSVNKETEEVGVSEMVEMFWLTREKPVRYDASGLRIQIGGRRLEYEVFGSDGLPDHEFMRQNIGRRFVVKYDPWDSGSVRLYTQDADGSLRFARVAEPRMVIHRAVQDQTEGERRFIERELRENRNDRIERQISGRVAEIAAGTELERHGLKRARLTNMPEESRVAHEIEKEARRRMKTYGGAADRLGAGRIGKEISNMMIDPLDGEIKVDRRMIAGKL